jgi:hypothetical protein
MTAAVAPWPRPMYNAAKLRARREVATKSLQLWPSETLWDSLCILGLTA